MRAVVYILGFRNADRVKRLMDSPGAQRFETWIVDNDPGGPSPLPQGDNVLLGPGGGFTPGFNFCLRHFMCTYDTGLHIPVILNDDLELEEGCIDAMIQPIMDDPAVGIVAPMQVSLDNPAVAICGGFGAAYPSGQHRTGLRGDPGIKRSNPRWVTFCAVAINPTLVEKIGYLDEWMSMYYSDSDYSIRATDAGYRLVFDPEAVVRHENHACSIEFVKERATTRQLIMDKWQFETKWGERVRVHLS